MEILPSYFEVLYCETQNKKDLFTARKKVFLDYSIISFLLVEIAFFCWLKLSFRCAKLPIFKHTRILTQYCKKAKLCTKVGVNTYKSRH